MANNKQKEIIDLTGGDDECLGDEKSKTKEPYDSKVVNSSIVDLTQDEDETNPYSTPCKVTQEDEDTTLEPPQLKRIKKGVIGKKDFERKKRSIDEVKQLDSFAFNNDLFDDEPMDEGCEDLADRYYIDEDIDVAAIMLTLK